MFGLFKKRAKPEPVPEHPVEVEELETTKTSSGFETAAATISGQKPVYFMLEDNPKRLFKFYCMTPESNIIFIVWASGNAPAHKIASIKSETDQAFELIKA